MPTAGDLRQQAVSVMRLELIRRPFGEQCSVCVRATGRDMQFKHVHGSVQLPKCASPEDRCACGCKDRWERMQLPIKRINSTTRGERPGNQH